MIHSKLRLCAVALLSSSLVCLAGFAAAAVADDEATPYDHLEWRNVGPVNMSGRVAGGSHSKCLASYCRQAC